MFEFFLCLGFAIVAPYMICSINPAIIASRIKHKKDIREMGSGNPGLTNTLRTMGKRAAVTVLAFDMFKGVISILAVQLFCQVTRSVDILMILYWGTLYDLLDTLALRNQEIQLFAWIAALSAVIGHCYPIYHKFKGGKAVLITLATLLVIDWIAALILLSLFIIIVLLTRYVSLGSLIAGSLYPVGVYLVGTFIRGNDHMLMFMPFPIAVAVLLVFKHRKNLKRLFNGTENQINFGKTKSHS